MASLIQKETIAYCYYNCKFDKRKLVFGVDWQQLLKLVDGIIQFALESITK